MRQPVAPPGPQDPPTITDLPETRSAGWTSFPQRPPRRWSMAVKPSISAARVARRSFARIRADSRPTLPIEMRVTPELISLAPTLLSKPAPARIAPSSTGITVHLPHASGDHPRSTGRLSNLRDGPGAGLRLDRGGFRRSRADGHDPSVLDLPVLTSPLLLLSMAEMIPGLPLPSWLGGRSLVWIEFALATPVVLWGGFPFFERGWSSLVNRQAQHVHPDRDGDRRRVPVQRGRGHRARGSSRIRSEITMAQLASTSSLPRSSRRSFSWDRCSNFGPVARPGTRSGHSWAWPPRPPQTPRRRSRRGRPARTRTTGRPTPHPSRGESPC